MVQKGINNESRNNVTSLDQKVDYESLDQKADCESPNPKVDVPVRTLCNLDVNETHPNHTVKHTVNFQVDLALKFQHHSQVA